nr:g2-specific protein kinase fin1 [Quercus suber]
MPPKRPATQPPRTRARGELEVPVDNPERILKKRKRDAPGAVQAAALNKDDPIEPLVRQGYNLSHSDQVTLLPVDGRKKNLTKRKKHIAVAEPAPDAPVASLQGVLTSQGHHSSVVAQAAVEHRENRSQVSKKQKKNLSLPDSTRALSKDDDPPVPEPQTGRSHVSNPIIHPLVEGPDKFQSTQATNSSVPISVPPPAVYPTKKVPRKRRRDDPNSTPIPISLGNGFKGTLGRRQWDAQVANIAGLPLGEDPVLMERPRHGLPLVTPADPLLIEILSADEQSERLEEVHIKPDPDQPLPSGRVMETTELQYERYVARGFPELDTTLEALDEFVQQFAVHVFTTVWTLHVDQQNDLVLKVAAIIEMKENREALMYNGEYKLPDEDTSLNWYGRVTGRSHSTEDDTEYCEILGLGQNEGRGRHEGFSDEWNFAGTIGKGGNGHAALWVQYDSDNQIVDRVVSKETWVLKSQWRSGGGGVLVNGPTPALHSWEAYIQSLLCEKRGSDKSIVDIRASASYGNLYMYRIYTEHCEISGDLENAISRHGAMQENVDLHGQPLHGRIAEIAIWAVFETLTHAIYLMKHGLPPSKPGRSLFWPNEIVHFDIKPKNVFLKSPHPTDWPTIPQFRLGDYGSSRFIPTRRVPAGTPGYEAPEQSISWCQCNSAVNVWGVGAIIASLIQARQNLPVRHGMPAHYRERLVPEDAAEIAVFTQDDGYFYSEDLLNLTRRCCEIDVGQRIGVDELWREITAYVTRGPNPIKWRKRTRGETFSYDERAAYESLTRIMRLLNTHTLQFEEFFDSISNVPYYAILSHRWTPSETSYKHFRANPTNLTHPGCKKVLDFCAFARTSGMEYVWVDTCCIDIRSSAELSEAINSM